MATITSKSQMKFLFLQLLLLSSHCVSTEASLSSDVVTGDTSNEDLSSITLNHLRSSNKLSENDSSLSSATSNATDITANTNTTVSASSTTRHLRKKEPAISSNKIDLSKQTPITIPTPKEEGINPNMFRIVGGSQHDGSGMPNFAMLLARSRNQYYSSGCGGSLISPCHVLTAAHCVDNPSKVTGMGIYINAFKPWGDNNGLTAHFTTLSAYAIHPSYANSVNSRPVHDVAVLTLSKCVDQNDENPNLFLQNIMELATLQDWNRLNHGQALKVSGFGSTVITGIGDHSKENSNVLKTVTVPYQAQCAAQGYYQHGLVVDGDMMCAGQTGADACYGDSGGPLYYEYSSSTRHNRRKQYGVVSWGHGCGIANKPGVYASVAHHYDYIQRIVCRNPMVHMSNWSSSNMCGNAPTRRPTKPPTPAPTRRPSAPPTPAPTPRPTRAATPRPTRPRTLAPTDDRTYNFDNGATAARKVPVANNKVAQKLSGGSYVSSLSRIRGDGIGGSANKPNGGRRQLGADPAKGPEEAE